MNFKSQFFKVILLIVIAVVIFLGLKKILPDRLFPSWILNSEKSMLIDSVLLEALNDEQLMEDSLSNPIIGDSLSIRPETNDSLDKYAIKPFKQSNLSSKLEMRKPVLLIPENQSRIVYQRPVVDTLLDPTLTIQGYGYLQRFYSKLANLENKKNRGVRIAYFGDSMNDGDFIVQDFRSLLQERFGGQGVGFVSITSLSAAARASVLHKYSENWETQSFVSVKEPSTPFGIDGQVFQVSGDSPSWVSYTAGGGANISLLYSPTLFYGQSYNVNGAVDVVSNKEQQSELRLAPNNLLNVANLGVSSAKSLTLNFNNAQNIPIYGLDFSTNTGVHVDNFSLRGNSGLTLSKFNTGLMNAFDRVLNYDLIVLHYGTNVLNYGSLDYGFYERGMKAVINKLRSCFPNADILVISTADKSSKIEGEMLTDPAVIALTKAQKRFAREAGVGYIDLYGLMGGYNSMVKWVDKQLGNKDYTHFSVKGSKEIGTLLYKELERGYEKYNKQLKKELEQKK